MKRELPLPPDADAAELSVEMFRGWVVDGTSQFVLFPTAWRDDLPSWGRFLAEAAVHVADAIGETTGGDPREILNVISRAFLNEVREPTGLSEGEFFDRDA